MDDDADILLVAGGDSEAFERIVERNQRSLVGFFRTRRRGLNDEMDLAQEVFVRVFENARKFKPRSFRSWMYRIANNLLTDEWRRRRPSSMEYEPMDCRYDPAKIVELRDEANRVREHFEGLLDNQREAIEDFCFGYTQSEIAESQGVGVRTAQSRIRLARAAVLSSMEGSE